MLKKYQTLQFRAEVKVEAEGSYPDQGLAQIVPWAGCLSWGAWSGGAEEALWPWAGSRGPKSGAAGTFPSHAGSQKGYCGLRNSPLQRATRAARGGTAGRSEAPSPQPRRGAGARLEHPSPRAPSADVPAHPAACTAISNAWPTWGLLRKPSLAVHCSPTVAARSYVAGAHTEMLGSLGPEPSARNDF